MLNKEPAESLRGNLSFRLFGKIPKYVPFTRSYDVANKNIHVVAGDLGGWSALKPPLVQTLNAGCTVTVLFTASCRKLYEEGKLTTDDRMTVICGLENMESVTRFLENDYDLLVVGSSQSKEGAEAAFNAIMVANTSCLAVQDLYGSFMPTLKLLQESRGLGNLGCLCVTDEFAKSQVLQQYNLSHCIAVTGGAQFDKTVAVKEIWQQRRAELRSALGVTDSQPVFLAAGQLNGTAEMLKLLESAIEQAGVSDQAKVIVRAHPRGTDEDKRLLQEYMDRTKRDWFTDVDRDLARTSDDLLPAVDFVLSGYSTTNYYAVLYEMPGVVYVGTPAFKQDLKAEKGLDRPPEVGISAGWYVQTPQDMTNVITSVYLQDESQKDTSSVDKIRDAQKRIAAYNDGKATQRVWQEMQKLMAD